MSLRHFGRQLPASSSAFVRGHTPGQLLVSSQCVRVGEIHWQRAAVYLRDASERGPHTLEWSCWHTPEGYAGFHQLSALDPIQYCMPVQAVLAAQRRAMHSQHLLPAASLSELAGCRQSILVPSCPVQSWQSAWQSLLLQTSRFDEARRS